MFDGPDGPAKLALFAFSALFVALRTWVEIRDLLNERRARRNREEEEAAAAREPPVPSPPFDPIAHEKRRQEMLAAGWKEWAPGIFTQEAWRPSRERKRSERKGSTP